jgi:DNA-binding CsgD family transcriptional regulator
MASVVRSGTELLERDDALATLEEAFASARAGLGRLVFVSGDAGIGKSALVRAFRAELAASTRVLTGSCDGLRTPRPLGPLADIAAAAGGRLGEVVAAGAGALPVFDALLDELRASPDTVVVVEDVHWADEATLDILGLLGRRVGQAGALVLATYRTDELARTHPLRIVLGDLATVPGVLRVHLEPLSAGAVAELAAPHGVDAAELHARTAGNPFFVTEALASGAAEVPATIRDAVFARAARLDRSARDLLDAVAIVPQQTELWLLEELAGDAASRLDDCLASGMLRAGEHGVAFRHELARLAVEESIYAHRRVELHRAALRALRSPPDGVRDLARLAHHAEAAGDAASVLELAPAAGERAAAVGAHREAAAQFARALRYADGLPPAQRAELLERRSYECHLTSQHAEAIAALEEALECYRSLGDLRSLGLGLDALAARRWCASDTAGAEAATAEAIDVLERLGPSRDLAHVYAGASSLAMNLEKAGAAFAWGGRALELVEDDDAATIAYQLNNTGTMALLLGRPDGLAELERSIVLAAEAGLHDEVGRGYIHLGWAASRTRAFSLLDRLDRGIEYCTEHGLELWRLYVVAYRARLELEQGRWTDAAESASFVLGQPNQAPLLRLLALTVLGVVRARRGDPEWSPPLEESHAIAAGTSDLQHLAPVAIARTEVASLTGDGNRALEASEAVLALAQERGAAWIVGELALWRRRAGVDEPCPAGAAEPYALHLDGEPARAAEHWRRLGCPYEAALALGDAADGDLQRRALAELRELGAGPAAARLAARLRERGERGLARGPRPATRANPAGLTAREVEVLALVADGLRNAEIAARLVVSRRTVDHHVSTILRKLDVSTRVQAGAEAVRLGLAAQDR